MRLKIEEKRNPRTGNPITVISGIQHNPQVIDQLESKLKRACGAGGFTKGKTITIHGSHKEKIKTLLEKEGFEVNIL